MKALVPLSVALLLALSACGDDDGASLGAPPSPSASPSTAAPTPVASSDTEARAVYWLGATKEARGPRLYREFVRRPATGDAVRDAVTAMLSTDPQDPDYTSLWADGTTVREVRREGTTAVVDLSREATTNGGGSAFEEMTLQQLVHTVTAADPAVKAVRLLVEGEPVETLWGSADASRPLVRGPSYEVLGPVWLDVVDGSVLTDEFGGTATVFEATVSWQLRQGPELVEEGFATATEGGPGRGEWTATADVPPGDYELWAYESSAEDGRVTWLDTKRVTVR